MYKIANYPAFYLLSVLAGLVFMIFLYKLHKSKKLNNTFGKQVLSFLSQNFSNSRIKWKYVLEITVLLFVIVSLARIQSGKGQKKIKSEGVEIVFAVDVSKSMLTEDVRPSRLALVKNEMNRLIGLLGGDKVGLVAFAGSAALISPITNDKSAIKMYIESLSPDSVGSQGTEFKKALVEAQSAFKRGGLDVDSSTALTKVIILISDGEDNEPGALKAAEKITEDGIKIFTLAVGTKKGGSIPIRDKYGNLNHYLKDRSGSVVLSQTKGKLLSQIASSGKGSFYHLSFSGSAMNNLADDISRLEKAQFDAEYVTSFDDKYQWFLFIAIVISLIEIAIFLRKKSGRIWKGRFEVQKSWDL